MNKVIIMKEKDLETIKILQLLLAKQMSQIQAAKQLDISKRQVRNKLQRSKEFEDKGVISKNSVGRIIINYQKILNLRLSSS